MPKVEQMAQMEGRGKGFCFARDRIRGYFRDDPLECSGNLTVLHKHHFYGFFSTTTDETIN
jgi:hypothetical protein